MAKKRMREAEKSSKKTQAQAKSNERKRRAEALRRAREREEEMEAQDAPKIYQIKVILAGSKPQIWRRIEVSAECTLKTLRQIIATVMDWDGLHLHEFKIGRKTYGNPEFDDDFSDLRVLDEGDVTLHELGLRTKSKFSYRYDFGDNWEHTLLVENVLEEDPTTQYPVCTGGEMAAPPDDCGGLWGYYQLQEILDNPADPEYEELREWFGGELDATAFDVEAINRRLDRLRQR
jgi:hypothetical protein